MREPNDWREKGVDVQVLDETLVDGGNELIVAILETWNHISSPRGSLMEPTNFQERVIRAPTTNEIVEMVNDHALSQMPGEDQ